MKLKEDNIKTYEVRNRALFTLGVVLLYIIGRGVVLYGVDLESIHAESAGAQELLLSVVSGDRYRYSILALGIMPYITVSMLVTLVTMLRSADARARMSPRRIERMTYLLTMLVSLVLAITRAEELPYLDTGMAPLALKALTVLELMAGAVVILVMAAVNKKHGFAGQIPIILVNVSDSLLAMVSGHGLADFRVVGVICVVVAACSVAMECILVRIPVQRVSIHNDYADKSYIAYKLSPIGTMPVMFATVVFMLPQLLVGFLASSFPENAFWNRLAGEMVMTRPTGVWTYLFVVLLLSILGAFLMLSPGDSADQLQRGGDSIVGVYAGKKTKWYLRRRLLLLSFFSGVFMSTCMGISLFMALGGKIPADLAMLPSMAMILVGIATSLVQEISAYVKFDSYKAVNWE